MNIKASINKLVVDTSANKKDVRSLLKKDHEEALKIAKEMYESDDAAHRKALLSKLKPALVAHSRAEESAVYDPLLAMKSCEEARGIGNEGYVEHGLLDELLEGLAKAKTCAGEKWKAKGKVLYELLSHHVEEEHDVMFSELAKHYDSDQLVAMGKAFEAAKLEIKRAA